MNTRKTTDLIETKAQITAVHKDIFELMSERGRGFAQIKRGSYSTTQENYPVTGDYVMVDWRGQDHSLILRTLPRRAALARANEAENKAQIIAANFDYVFILQALNRDFNLRRLERYLTLAWQSGGDSDHHFD